MKKCFCIVIMLSMVMGFAGCMNGTLTENEAQQTLAPTAVVTTQATPMPTPEPTTIPLEEAEALFGLSVDKDSYSKDVDIIQLTIIVPENTVSWGAYAPMLEKRTEGGWEAVYPEIGYCGTQEEMTNGRVIELMMALQYPDIETGQYRVYLDIYSDMDPEKASRVYAEFEMMEE